MKTKMYLKFILFVTMIGLFFGCSKSSNEENLSSDTTIENIIIRNHNAVFDKKENKISIVVTPSDVTFQKSVQIEYEIQGLASKARTSIPLKGNLTVENGTEFYVYAQDQTKRTITFEINYLAGISSLEIVNNLGMGIANSLVIKDNNINVIINKEDFMSDDHYGPFKLTFQCSPNSYVEPLTSPVISLNHSKEITFVDEKKQKTKYMINFLNSANYITWFELAAYTFRLSPYPGTAQLSQLKARPAGEGKEPFKLDEKYKIGLRDSDLVVFTLESDYNALKSANPKIIRTSANAKLSPSKEDKLDFTKDVIYKVTAEKDDTSIKEYVIRTHFLKLLTRDLHSSFIRMNKDRGYFDMPYFAISPIKSATLVNMENNISTATTLEHFSTDVSDNKQVYITPSKSLTAGIYRLEVTLENGDFLKDIIQKFEVK